MTPLLTTPITLYLIYRSYTHSSLTLPGILLAALTATIHSLPTSPIPFTLLIVFFLLGTSATKVKKEVKANLTLSSTGHRMFTTSGRVDDWFGGGWNKHRHSVSEKVKSKVEGEREKEKKVPVGGQEPRSAIQVLANSGCASLLCLLHYYIYGLNDPATVTTGNTTSDLLSSLPGSVHGCIGSIPARDLILAGIIANYAAVTADTLSSELGILSSVRPRFILSLAEVPPGTNGGVTGTGLFAGLGGAVVIGVVSVLLLPDLWNWKTCSTVSESRAGDLFGLILAVGAWGALGSLLDSILGALFQASVVDRRSGKVVEAHNGGRVLVSSREQVPLTRKEKVDGVSETASAEVQAQASRIVGSGRDILDNNQVNFLMAGVMTVGGIGLASLAWEVPVSSLWGV